MKVVTAGVAAGSTAMLALTTAAMNASGELEQNMGGSEAVFKASAGRMQETAKKAFSDMGLSASNFLGTANKMGALFQGAGFEIEASADMSAKAMQRAADVASIMGIDVNSAMEAVAGMAKGNFTMMDNLGVAINDTTLQIYAQEKGLGKLETTQDKVNAAYQLFMEKSEYAAGNYKKENETFAGAMTTAKAALENFLSGAGTAEELADAFVGLADVTIEKLNELFPELVNGITKLIEKITPEIPRLLQSILPGLIQGAVALVNGLVQAMPAIVDVLMSVLPDLLNGVLLIANAIISALPQIMEMICAALPGLVPQLVSGIVTMIVALASMYPKLIQPILDNLPEILISVVKTLADNLPILIEGAAQLIIGLAQGLIEALPLLIECIPEILLTLTQAIVNSAPTLLKAALALIDTLANAMITYLPKLLLAVPQLLNALRNKFLNLISGFKDIGINIVNGIWNGISSGWNWLINKVKTLADNLLSAAKDVLGIHSPSTKFAYLGEMCVAGWEEGTEDLLNTDKMVDNINATFGGLQPSINSANGGNSSNITTNVTVTLEGEAKGLFKAVQKENMIYTKSTGRNGLA